MALVAQRRAQAAPVLAPELDLSAAPLPPFEQDEGGLTPEGSGYEILLQVRRMPRVSVPQMRISFSSIRSTHE